MIRPPVETVAFALALTCVSASQSESPKMASPIEIVSATVDPIYDSLLAPRKRGWLGADGAVSIPLDKDRTLWIFGDTILGTMNDEGARKGPMVRNTIAVQDISSEGPGKVEFYWDLTDKVTGDFFHPADFAAPYWYWPGVGAMVDGELFLFLYKLESGAGDPGFDFAIADLTLCRVSNPLDSPDTWKKSYQDLGVNGSHQGFSSAILVEEPYVYLLGYDDGPENSHMERAGVLARIKTDRLKAGEGRDAFEFWTEGQEGPAWRPTPENVIRLFTPGTTEASLEYLPEKKLYLATSYRGFHEKMYVVTAPTLTGPWSEPLEVYTIPEVVGQDNYHAYAMKSHPELARRPDELVLTYVVNSKDFWSVFRDNTIYYPRFVRVKFR